MISDEERRTISNFITSCNELIYGKFILADNKISNILKNIVSSEEIYSFLSIAMEDFNYSRELMQAEVKTPTKPGYFVLPEDENKIIALVFSILVDIDNHKIDFGQFLKDYFSLEENGLTGYSKFAKQLIEPFKNMLASHFEISPNTMEKYVEEKVVALGGTTSLGTSVQEEKNVTVEAEPVGEDAKDSEQEYARKIKKVASEMLQTLQSDIHSREEAKEDAKYILKVLNSACDSLEIKYVNALIISLGYMTKHLKCIKYYIMELKNLLIEFYI